MAKRSYRRSSRRSKRRSVSQAVNEGFQNKMKLGEPGDAFEKQADKVADHVTNKPGNKVQAVATTKVSPLAQTKPAEEKKEETAQAKGQTTSTTVAPTVAKTIHKSKGDGQKLPNTTRSFMENRIGADFNDVKIHTDQKSTWMNKQLKAQAFTHGSDIFFNSGKFKPNSKSGQHLLAHELTHVIQQGKAKPKVQKQEMDAGVADASSVDATTASPDTEPRDAGLPAGVPPVPDAAPAPASSGNAFAIFGPVDAPTTPAGMINRIPPRVNTSVTVMVGGWHPPMADIILSVENAGAGNGNATINGSATHSMNNPGTIDLQGQTQTSPGKAGNLRLVAKQGGVVLGQSQSFSVAAIPQNWNGSIQRTIRTGAWRGIEIADRWESDSGVVADLNQVWISEEVETKFADGVYTGTSNDTSDYLGPAISFSSDEFASPVSIMTGEASQVDDQTSIFWDKRTGSKDIPLKNSGYRIIEVIVLAGGKHWQQITRKGKKTTANSHGSQAGGGSIDSGIIEV